MRFDYFCLKSGIWLQRHHLVSKFPLKQPRRMAMPCAVRHPVSEFITTSHLLEFARPYPRGRRRISRKSTQSAQGRCNKGLAGFCAYAVC